MHEGATQLQASDAEFSLVFGRALGKVVVSIHGPVDARTAPELRHRLRDLIDGQGNRHVVLDLRGTTLVDPAGLTVFVNAHKRMQRIAGELVLSGPSPDVISAFRTAGLDKIFTLTPAWAHPAYGFGRSNAGDRAGWGRSG